MSVLESENYIGLEILTPAKLSRVTKGYHHIITTFVLPLDCLATNLGLGGGMNERMTMFAFGK